MDSRLSNGMLDTIFGPFRLRLGSDISKQSQRLHSKEGTRWTYCWQAVTLRPRVGRVREQGKRGESERREGKDLNSPVHTPWSCSVCRTHDNPDSRGVSWSSKKGDWRFRSMARHHDPLDLINWAVVSIMPQFSWWANTLTIDCYRILI